MEGEDQIRRMRSGKIIVMSGERVNADRGDARNENEETRESNLNENEPDYELQIENNREQMNDQENQSINEEDIISEIGDKEKSMNENKNNNDDDEDEDNTSMVVENESEIMSVNAENVVQKDNERKQEGQIDISMLMQFLNCMNQEINQNMNCMNQELNKNIKEIKADMNIMKEDFQKDMKGMDERFDKLEKVNVRLEEKLDRRYEDLNVKVQRAYKDNQQIKKNCLIMEEKVNKVQMETAEIEKKVDQWNGEIRKDISEVCQNMIEEKWEEKQEVMYEHVMKKNEKMNIENNVKILDKCDKSIRKSEENYKNKLNHIEKKLINRIDQEKIENDQEKMQSRDLINENCGEIMDQVKKLKEEMEKKITNGGQEFMHFQNGILDQNLKFFGNENKIHPKAFLKTLLARIAGIKNFETKKEWIRGTMYNEAQIWFASVEERINNEKDFINMFLGKYWGEVQQERCRERLHFGKYQKGGLNYHAMKMYMEAQYLEPQMCENEIVRYIARQFEVRIRETIILNDIKSMEQLSNYLIRIENGMLSRNGDQEMNERREDRRIYPNYNNNNNNYERRINYGNRNNWRNGPNNEENRINWNDRREQNRNRPMENWRGRNNRINQNFTNSNQEHRQERRQEQDQRRVNMIRSEEGEQSISSELNQTNFV